MTADITSEADAEEAKIADTASADILDEVNEQVSQNEPEVDGGTKGTVA